MFYPRLGRKNRANLENGDCKLPVVKVESSPERPTAATRPPPLEKRTASKTAILLVNLGSPDAPTASAVRRYLKPFLSDQRVVEARTPAGRLVWKLILHLLILRIRPARAARAYRKIWTTNGAPLLDTSRKQLDALRHWFGQHTAEPPLIELAMTYGQPAIDRRLQALRQHAIDRLVVLPLYPQFSATTSAAVFDQVSATLQGWRHLPELIFIRDYHDNRHYIDALAGHIRAHWQEPQRGHCLLMSFHGIPQRYVDNGDPYYRQCQRTARLLADALDLDDEAWRLVFQSRFGREPWLQPYCTETLQALPAAGIDSVDVVCPGFAADCLETLEEINMENRARFLDAGGRHFGYIPCLNDQPPHIEALGRILCRHLPDNDDD